MPPFCIIILSFFPTPTQDLDYDDYSFPLLQRSFTEEVYLTYKKANLHFSEMTRSVNAKNCQSKIW